eukprot:TRINITY_DN11638_c0_g1_i1.p1 TRINITY_DN11638_c0_g1~~TRINITY_DN11638_c0_g1_i1.p1  ORF type:complete len:616 (+),score=84.16 TRINITY_DN11638_c0_g1_i1:22-1869(+)
MVEMHLGEHSFRGGTTVATDIATVTVIEAVVAAASQVNKSIFSPLQDVVAGTVAGPQWSCESSPPMPPLSQSRQTSTSLPSASSSHSDRSSSSTSSSYQSEPFFDEEENDCVGGFHPVRQGELLGGHYRAERRLGIGHFSVVWACRDERDGRPVAIKLLKSVEKYKSVAAREIDLLKTVSRRFTDPSWRQPRGLPCNKQTSTEVREATSPYIVRLLEHFEFEGPHGIHPCLVLEKMGPTLLEILMAHSHCRLPLCFVRLLARDILHGLDLLHAGCNLIHADLKPENILISRSVATAMIDSVAGGVETEADEKEGDADVFIDSIFAESREECALGEPLTKRLKHGADGPASQQSVARRRSAMRSAVHCALSSGAFFCLADLGNSRFADNLRKRSSVQTFEYKPPEAIVGAGYDASSDIWALGCVLFEAAAGRRLFNPHCMRRKRRLQLGKAKRDVPPEEEHIAQIVEVLGPLPEDMLRRGKYTEELLRWCKDESPPRSALVAPFATPCRRGFWTLRCAGLALGDALPPQRRRLPARFRRRLLVGTKKSKADQAGESGATVDRAGGNSIIDGNHDEKNSVEDQLAGLMLSMMSLDPRDRPCARTLLGESALFANVPR